MIKKYLLPVCIVLLFAGLIFISVKLSNQTKQSKELEETYTQNSLLLQITMEELMQGKDSVINSLMDSLSIKPKEVIRYRTTTVNFTDTTNRKAYIPAFNSRETNIAYSNKSDTLPYIRSGQYPFIQEQPCYKVEGYVSLDNENKELSVYFTGVDFKADNAEILYKTRKRKFLFIRFGKWVYAKAVTNDCGEFESREVEVVKK